MRYTSSFSVVLLLFGILLHSGLTAQEFEKEIESALKSEPRVIAHLDSRSAFISSNGVQVFGIKVGLQYAEKLTFGIGYNQLSSRFYNHINYQGVDQRVELKYWYLSPFVEYTFYQDRQWELMIPVQLGFGESYYLTDLDSRITRNSWVLSYEPAIAFQYRFLEVLGVGLGVGYRLMLWPNTKLEERFTSPVYMFKFKVYFEDLLDEIRQR